MLHQTFTAAAPLWTAEPRAALLLASCAARPPVAIERTATYAITRDEWWEYVGYRVECLTRIHARAYADAERLADATGDYDGLTAFLSQPSVQAAVEAAATSRLQPLKTYASCARQLDPAAWGMAA